MTHRQLEYGRIERERRFLLAEPPDLTTADRVCDIVDRYLRGTGSASAGWRRAVSSTTSSPASCLHTPPAPA